MQTEAFIINNLLAKGWSSSDSSAVTRLVHGQANVVEHSGNSVRAVMAAVIQREGWRGLFKVCVCVHLVVSLAVVIGCVLCSAGLEYELDQRPCVCWRQSDAV